MTRSTLTTLTVATLTALALFGPIAASAEAQQRRSGPLFVSAGLGPYVLFSWDTSFRLEGELGWHPGGRDEGFFVAADFAFSVERRYAMVFGGVRLGGDIEVFENRDVAVLLTPNGLAGFGWIDLGDFYDGEGYFILQPSFQVDVALLERVLWVWARPVSFDFLLFPDAWRERGRGVLERGFWLDWGYSFMAGVRFNFG
ncbi:MAG: hypothetical protein OHK0013_33940 [Sandaracinaceae bacterium]